MAHVACWEDWAVYVCDNTFHLQASQQSASPPQGKLSAVRVADVTPKFKFIKFMSIHVLNRSCCTLLFVQCNICSKANIACEGYKAMHWPYYLSIHDH